MIPLGMQYTPSLSDIFDELNVDKKELGFCTVSLDKIIGMSRNDLPSAMRMKKLWKRYLEDPEARECQNHSDPIHLVLYKGKYYVHMNGNHRIILLKAFGRRYGINTVTAEVSKYTDIQE